MTARSVTLGLIGAWFVAYALEPYAMGVVFGSILQVLWAIVLAWLWIAAFAALAFTFVVLALLIAELLFPRDRPM